MQWLRSLLSTDIHDKYRKEFSENNVMQNSSRCIVISALTIVLEILILSNSFRHSVQIVYGAYLIQYRLLYIAMIVASSISFLLLLWFKNRSNKYGPLTRILMITMILFMNWASIVSVIDSVREVNSSFYMFIALAISVLIIMNPVKSLMLYTSSLIVFLVLTYFFVEEPSIAFSNYTNSFSVFTTAWIISLLFYKHQRDDFLKQKIIYEQNKQLKYLTSIDPLTGILNRRALDTEMKRLFEKSVNEQSGMLVMMIDIDYYKGYNDTYGHIEGDHVLVLVAKTLKDVIANLDNVIGRYGGDEFCLAIQCDALSEAERLRNLLHEEVGRLAVVNEASKVSKYLTISIGLVYKKPDKEDKPWNLIRDADIDLYRFKEERMNRRSDD